MDPRRAKASPHRSAVRRPKAAPRMPHPQMTPCVQPRRCPLSSGRMNSEGALDIPRVTCCIQQPKATASNRNSCAPKELKLFLQSKINQTVFRGNIQKLQKIILTITRVSEIGNIASPRQPSKNLLRHPSMPPMDGIHDLRPAFSFYVMSELSSSQGSVQTQACLPEGSL